MCEKGEGWLRWGDSRDPLKITRSQRRSVTDSPHPLLLPYHLHFPSASDRKSVTVQQLDIRCIQNVLPFYKWNMIRKLTGAGWRRRSWKTERAWRSLFGLWTAIAERETEDASASDSDGDYWWSRERVWEQKKTWKEKPSSSSQM